MVYALHIMHLQALSSIRIIPLATSKVSQRGSLYQFLIPQIPINDANWTNDKSKHVGNNSSPELALLVSLYGHIRGMMQNPAAQDNKHI